MEGLSVRSIFVNCIVQAVVLLYLIDEGTSWLVVGSSAVGLAIEMWKITKAVHVTVDRSGVIPRLRFKQQQTYLRATSEHDEVLYYC